ncbi:MAG: hypothetical protein WDA41_11050 [Candidatus Neomarinimicrobiota bacterium]|jgi:LytS/YehU family sensor histidine kinase|nr:hypothetical protein [Candidatus Neomarinimicrobiota bacterium]
MGIRILSTNAEKPFSLWLPGILIWLMLLFCMLILIIPVFLILIGLLIWNLIPGQRKNARAYTRIFFSIPGLLCALRGLTVDVESPDTIVKIYF